MNVLNQSNFEIIRQLGGFQHRIPENNYRKNIYLLECETEQGTIIYNFFTGAAVMLKPVEYINIFTKQSRCDYVNFLVENFFLVHPDFDEYNIVKELKNRQWVFITSNYLNSPKHFTILTTTTCNARCFYCYEKNAGGKKMMTTQTAEDVADYIIKHAPNNEQIALDWFGGEPLFNQKVIDIICSRVASAGISYSSSIVSNSFLFDLKTIEKARNDWNLNFCQVTLDGTEEVYNKAKNYIYKDVESPYKIVKENMHHLLKHDVAVTVRMNVGSHNFDNLKELIKELTEEYKEYKNFAMYVWPIFEEGFTRNDQESEILYSNMLELDKLISAGGYDLVHNFTNRIEGTHCMADNGSCVVIFPDGKIGICEHYIDSKFVTDIYHPEKLNFEVIKDWRTYLEFENCKNCPVFPQCLKLKGCPDDNRCDKFKQQYTLEHLKLCLEKLNQNFNKTSQEQSQKKEEDNQSCQCCKSYNPNGNN